MIIVNIKSKELNHLHLHVVVVLLFESLNKYFSSFLTFLRRLFVIKRVASQPKISHNSIINIEEVEHREDNHENGKNIQRFLGDSDLPQELLELSFFNGRKLEVVVAQGVADPR